ncbi:GH17556 [Drosophila grimshawi]|uniref:GH17556 n=1 Tax=Drosophila grimshawi TaxID=7222 RepID=B4JXK1_DROGR|nr:GH17556 [Drosophila grimshawi]
MHKEQGPSPQNDLNNTPEHLRPGFNEQQPVRQYDPRDFGLTGNEEWRHPGFFRNLRYETDDEPRQQQQHQRQARYYPFQSLNLNNLPEEQLADMSAPAYNVSIPSHLSRSDNEYLANISPPDMAHTENEAGKYPDSVYQQTVHSLKHQRGDTLLDPLNNNVHTTHHKITTYRDPSGNITSQVEETSTVSNAPCDQLPTLDCTPAGVRTSVVGAPIRHLHFSMPVQLDDISMPSFQDTSMPAMSTRIAAAQNMTSECLADQSAPSFIMDSSDRRLLARPNNVSNFIAQSIGNNTCLEDVSMPSFPHSTLTSHYSENLENEYNECLDNLTMPSFAGVSGAGRGASPGKANCVNSECQNNVSPLFVDCSTLHSRSIQRPEKPTVYQHERNTAALQDISMPSFADVSEASSGRAATRQQQTMPSQNISDISAPSFGSTGLGPMTTSGQEPSNNEFIGNVSMPYFGGVSGASRERTPTRPQQTMPSKNISDISAPSFGSTELGPMTSSGQGPTHNQFIDDFSMPSFGGVSGASRGRTPIRQQQTMPSQNICDISAPSFGSTGVGPMTTSGRGPSNNEFIEDVSMPSFGGVSGASSGRTPIRQQQTMPSQNISDISAPSFGSTGLGPMTTSGQEPSNNEFIEDVSMPSFGGVSGASRGRTPTRQQQTMPSQNICDISAPSFGSTGVGPMTTSGRGPSNNEFIEDVSMPSFGGVSGASRGRTPTRQQQTMPSQNICDISAPSFGSTGLGPMTTSGQEPSNNEFIGNVSMPSFGGVSGASRGRTATRQQQTMPSQNISDISAPSFGSTGLGPMTTSGRGPSNNEFIEDVSMPSLGGVSGASRGRTPTRQQQTMPSQNICDISAPSFGSTGLGPMTTSGQGPTHNQLIGDFSMPSFGGVSGASRATTSTRQQQTMPSQNISDISAPSFGSTGLGPMTTSGQEPSNNEFIGNVSMPSFGGVSGAFRGRTPTRQQQPMPSQNICDISAPSFGSTGVGPMTTSGRGPTNNEFIEDVSMPSLGGVSGASRGRTRQQQTMPSQNICDISAPSFGSTGLGPMTSSGQGPTHNQLIDDFSMPSFGGVSGASRGRTATRQQQTMPSQNISDISAPSFGSTGLGPMTTSGQEPSNNEFIGNVSMPSFGGVSGASRATTSTRQQQTMPSQNISDISAPSFGSTGLGPMTTSGQEPSNNEFIGNVSMPSFGGVSGAFRGRTPTRQQQPMPSQNICDISAPSFGSTGVGPMTTSGRGPTNNEFIEDVSMPYFGGLSGASRGRTRQQQTMPSQNINDISAPSFGSTGLGPMTTSGQGPSNNEFIGDVSMPSFEGVSGASRGRTPTRQQQPMPSQNICDISAPSFGSTGLGPMTTSGQEPSNNEFIGNVSMPSFGGVSGASRATTSTRQQQTMPSHNICDISAPSFGSTGLGPMTTSGQEPSNNEFIEDVSMPSFGGVSGASSGRIPTRQQQTMPSQNICDISAPSFGSTGVGPMTTSGRGPSNNEFIEDVSMPYFGGVSGASRGRTPTRQQQPMPSQNICDISAPSFGSTGLGPMTTSGQEPSNNEFIGNVSMPSFGGVSGASRATTSTRQQQTMPSHNICDISAPSFGSTGLGPMTTSGQEPSNNEFIEDVSMPSFGGVSGASSGRIPTRQQQTMPSQNICDISAPSFGSTGVGPMTTSGRGPSNNEFIEDVSMPSFGAVSGASRGRTPTRQQQPMPSQNICDISAPSFGSTGLGPMTTSGQEPSNNEFIGNVSMPSFGGVSGASRATTSTRQQQTMPSHNICDISAPSFGSTGLGPMTTSGQEPSNNEFIEDVSMPSFGGVSGASSGRIPTRQQQTMPSQNICDISAPSFESTGLGPMNTSGRGPSNNEFIGDVSMPYFGGVSGASRGRTPTRQQQTMPSHNICDISAPSFGSTGFGPMTTSGQEPSNNEFIGDVNMTFFGGVSGASAPEFMEDVSLSSFGGVSVASRARNQSHQKRSLHSQTVRDILAQSFQNSRCGCTKRDRLENMLSFGSSGKGLSNNNNKRLEDVSMPSFEGVSGASRGRTATRQQQTMPSHNISDNSAPSFGSNGLGAMTSSGQGPSNNEFIGNVNMPSFGGVSGASRGRYPTRQQHNNICDSGAPPFGKSRRSPVSRVSSSPKKHPVRSLSQEAKPRRQQCSSADLSNSGRGQLSNECLENVTMPSLAGASGATSSRWNITGNQRRPRFESTNRSERLDNVTPPSCGMSSRVPGNRSQLPNVTSEYLTDISMDSMQSGISPRRVQSFPAIPSQQQIGDITAPSMYDSNPISRTGQRCPANVSYPSEMLGNQSAPSYCDTTNLSNQSGIKDPIFKNLSSTNENSDNITKPSLLFNGSALADNDKMSTKVAPKSSCPKSNKVKHTSDNKISNLEQSGARCREIKKQSDQLSNKTDRSLQNKTQGPVPVKVEVKHVTLRTSLTSVKRSCTVNNVNAEDTENSCRYRDQNVCQPNIEDISMPAYESMGISPSPGQSTKFLTDISEPSYGPSYQSTQQPFHSEPNRPNETFHGFDSMDNYAPFDELVNSTPQTQISNQESVHSYATPEAVRRNNAAVDKTSNAIQTSHQQTQCSCKRRMHGRSIIQ